MESIVPIAITVVIVLLLVCVLRACVTIARRSMIDVYSDWLCFTRVIMDDGFGFVAVLFVGLVAAFLGPTHFMLVFFLEAYKYVLELVGQDKHTGDNKWKISMTDF